MVVAAFTSSYTNRSPYLTVAEYQAAPTALDTSQLVFNAGTGEETQVLAEIIGRASSWIDTFCCGAQGTLCASANTEVGRVLSDRWGRWIVHPRYWPILEVTAFQVGSDPSTLNTVPLSVANCWIEEQQFIVTNGIGLTTSAGPLEFSTPARPGREGFAQWSYVNGWVNTTLSQNAAQAATSIQLASVVGVYPGSSFMIYDAAVGDEPVTVSPSWAPGANPVTLTSGLQFAHTAGISVTALPPAVKQAAIFLTSALIKSRGDTAIVISDVGEPNEKATGEMLSAGDQAIAAELLAPFQVIWGQR